MRLLRSVSCTVLILLGFAFTLSLGCGGGSSSPTDPTPNTSTPSTPASAGGNYTLSMRASTSCPALSVNWPVTIIQAGSGIGITDNDRTPFSSRNYSMTAGGMTGTVSGATVSVNLDMVYVLNTTGEASWRVTGQFTGTASGTTITGTLNGRWGVGFTGCTATNHPFTFTRQ